VFGIIFVLRPTKRELAARSCIVLANLRLIEGGGDDGRHWLVERRRA